MSAVEYPWPYKQKSHGRYETARGRIFTVSYLQYLPPPYPVDIYGLYFDVIHNVLYLAQSYFMCQGISRVINALLLNLHVGFEWFSIISSITTTH